jgi:hypothetical protein
MYRFAYNCNSLNSYINPDAFWNNSNITSFNYAFDSSINIENYCEIPENWGGDNAVICGTNGFNEC